MFARLCSPVRRWVTVLAGVFAITGGSASSRSAEPLTIDIDAAAPGTPVLPTLYGAFFEEINRAGDGGLYAEMLQNRSFEDAPEPVAWTLLKPPGETASWSLDTAKPLNANNAHSLRLNLARTSGGRVGIANDGFKGAPLADKELTEKTLAEWLPQFAAAASKSTDGICVRAQAEYRLSFFARCADGFNGPLTATLERRDGAILAQANVSGLGTEWKRFDAVLRATGNETDARFVLAAATPGTVWLDMISLFPAVTFKARPNGLRPDLAGMMTALRPAFLRFPGGSFVEGLRLDDSYRWKKTVGDLAARPGFQAIWGYRSTDGLGYHEYLQLCEDLGAAPLFVSNCGMSEREFAPPDQMPVWIQDTLDAIEYADGPATSPWGAQRARNGHPAPFNLRYVEIGNENGLDYYWGGGNEAQYTERYRPIYQAIKARYPAIVTIANSRADAPIEVLDEHYYDTSEWFQTHANLYDHYDRKGPKIYVGEYAVTKGCGNGNLKAALGEAAFMTGLERNGDIVAMSSYAPLFCNAAWMRWHPDAVFFNAAHVYGTPSYYAQTMFAANRADNSLPLKMSGGAAGTAPALFAVAGRRRATGELILKVVNPARQPVSATITLHGGGIVAATGSAQVMAAPSDAEENSFLEPSKVVPHDETVTDAASSFRHEFRANSITILRLQIRG